MKWTLATVTAVLLAASPAIAAPAPVVVVEDAVNTTVAERENSGAGKRIVLWEWTNTRDIDSVGNLRTSAGKLSSSKEIKNIMNWETWRPTELPTGLYYQPMVRTKAQTSGDAWNNLLSAINSQPNKNQKPIVHFYNEPEYNGISAQDAANTWKSLMLPLRSSKGVELVGPAISSSPEGVAWLKSFMGYLSSSEKPNYVGAHFYTNKDSGVDGEISAAKNHLSGLISSYGLPLIVSEIASTSRNYNDVYKFTTTMSDWLDGQSKVKMYGFFGVSRQPVNDFVSPQAQLLDTSGSWTALGKYLGGF
ncbi:glycosyl hydrolase catalytic core-domain-containing protein [Microdochium trichocladiopsis]|uniref:Glycosyl hydrolase catalytic core-domain-containing protein n=1 Tax=Microdochium trichocladiopsis TaxID=1682393 RepID=A0A9P9BUY9_9PEZI|nr:glycosyl hydrolase catalytic core-domain-containing protein [Microdochium trichocladiopsis]KAH7039748.1 glycosyl hydrolase catalytic core-domain-containing protein [Microdochium trichocladiopsis]